MTEHIDQLRELAQHCELCREDVRDRIAVVDRRLLALELLSGARTATMA